MDNSTKLNSVLRTVALSKYYGAFPALNNFSFSLKAGEVHVLFGENGAGKSTLISVLSGAAKPTDGTVLFKEKTVLLNSVKQARELGISAVYQEFSLIPQMTVAENIFLGAEITKKGLLCRKALNERSQQIVDKLEFDLPVDAQVSSLTRAEQQMVEIAKAFRSEVSVLILDEPTASLSDHESNQLFRVIKQLSKKDVAVIYITHRLSEIKAISDTVTILRDGQYIDTVKTKNTTNERLIEKMTGKKFGNIYPEINNKKGAVVFSTNALCNQNGSVNKTTMEVRAGEIVSLVGLVGSGKSDFGETCFGLQPIKSGKVCIGENEISSFSIKDRIDAGLIYVPSDRKVQGLFMIRPARENMSLISLIFEKKGRSINLKAEKKAVHKLAQQLDLQPQNTEMIAEQFSGGNQQKLMLSRVFAKKFHVIILNEPTIGVDVGARVEIYKLIAELAKNGVALIIISSDLPEALHLANRVYVFNQGSIRAELEGSQINERNVLNNFFGVT